MLTLPRNPSQHGRCRAPTSGPSTSWRTCSKRKRSGVWAARPASSRPSPWLRRPATSPRAAPRLSRRKKVGLPATEAYVILNILYIYKYRRLVGIGKLCALMACCFSCICADRVGHWSRQQKKWWTWHRAVCLSAPPAPPVTPTGTILSVGAPCGLSAHWPAPKVGKWRIWDDENLYHNLTVCWFLK